MDRRTHQKKIKEFKPWVKFALSCLFLLFAFIGSLMILKGTKPEIIPGKTYTYTTSPSVSYKVYLQENNFYEEKFLPMGRQYPSAIIDYVDIDLIYSLTGSIPISGGYTYNVKGTIIGNYENTSNGKSELWTKEYTIVPDTSDNIADKNRFVITKNVHIDYQEYNKVVNDFKTNFRLAIDAYLNVKMTIKANGDINGVDKKLNVVDTVEVNIPLNSSTIKIETKKNPLNNKVESTGEEKSHLVLTYLGIVLLIMVGLLFLLTYKFIYFSSKTKYIKKLNRILRTYSEILVEVEVLPDLDDEVTLIDITNFEDMVDLEEELKSPIMYEETSRGIQTVFIIAIDNYAYRYILEAD